jgi:hypothetical protein
MPRKKMKTSDQAVAKSIVTSADPIKAGNRSRLAMKRAGLENIKQAFKLFDIEDRFANVYAAVGFASSIAAMPFTAKQIHEFETIGRAKLAALGVVETAKDIGDQIEVIASVPITQQDALAALYALGLKRTGISTSRGFVELRGAAVIETLQPLITSMGGVLTRVERPAMPTIGPQTSPEADIATLPTVSEPASVSAETAEDVNRGVPITTVSGEAPVVPAAISTNADLKAEPDVAEAKAQPALDGSSAAPVAKPKVPPFLLKARQPELNSPEAAATPENPPTMAQVIAKVLDAPAVSVRPPPQPPRDNTSQP